MRKNSAQNDSPATGRPNLPRIDRPDVRVRDALTGRWLHFSDPRDVIVADRPADVQAALAHMDAALSAGYHVAGMLSYEAGAGMDPSLVTRDDPGFPAVVMGVFDPPEVGLAPLPPDPIGHDASYRATIERPAFGRAIGRIREEIREGNTYQVNFTYRLRGDVPGDPDILFRSLAHAQAATYAARMAFGPWLIASASPELLFRRDGDRISSRPMKGTAQRGRDADSDRQAAHILLASRKERAENLMIVDMVRNDLARIADIGSVRVPELFLLEAYPTVWQLTSLVTARSEAPLSAVLKALFPAASITGAPKAATMALIADLENHPRRIYTGSIGYAAPDGTAQFNVAIRTALVDLPTGQFEFGVGGGIVWDSESGNEWQESRTKAGILRFEQPEFELLETMKWSDADGFHLLDAHLGRLQASAAYFGFSMDLNAVRRALSAATEAAGLDPARVRLLVDRAGGIRVEPYPLEPSRRFEAPRVAIAPAAIPSVDPFLRHKTTHRTVYDRMLGLCPDDDDVLLWNERGEITESCFANVFLERDGKLLTPPLSAGLLPGTLRAALLRDGRAEERTLSPADILGGRILLGNSVRGLYASGPITDRRPGRSHTV